MKKAKKMKIWLCRVFLAAIFVFLLAIIFGAFNLSSAEENLPEENQKKIAWEENSIVTRVQKWVVESSVDNFAGIPHSIESEKALLLLQGKTQEIVLEEKSKYDYIFSFPIKCEKNTVSKKGILVNREWTPLPPEIHFSATSDWFITSLFIILPFILIPCCTRISKSQKEDWKKRTILLYAGLITITALSFLVAKIGTGGPFLQFLLVIGIILGIILGIFSSERWGWICGGTLFFFSSIVGSIIISVSDIHSAITFAASYIFYLIFLCAGSYFFVLHIPIYIQRLQRYLKNRREIRRLKLENE